MYPYINESRSKVFYDDDGPPSDEGCISCIDCCFILPLLVILILDILKQ